MYDEAFLSLTEPSGAGWHVEGDEGRAVDPPGPSVDSHHPG